MGKSLLLIFILHLPLLVIISLPRSAGTSSEAAISPTSVYCSLKLWVSDLVIIIMPIIIINSLFDDWLAPSWQFSVTLLVTSYTFK